MAKYDEIISRIKKILPKNADFDYIEDFKPNDTIPIDLLLFIKFVTPYRKQIKSIIIPISVTKWADVKDEELRLHNLKCVVNDTVYSTGEISSANAKKLNSRLKGSWTYWRFYFEGISLTSVFETSEYDPSALDRDMTLEDLLHINIPKFIDSFPAYDATTCKRKVLNIPHPEFNSQFVKLINQGTSLGNDTEKKAITYLFHELHNYFKIKNLPPLGKDNYYSYILINTRTHHSTDQIDIILLVATSEKEVKERTYRITCVEIKGHPYYNPRNNAIYVEYDGKEHNASFQVTKGSFAYSAFLQQNHYTYSTPRSKNGTLTKTALWFPNIEKSAILCDYTAVYHGLTSDVISDLVTQDLYLYQGRLVRLEQSFFTHELQPKKPLSTESLEYVSAHLIDRIKGIRKAAYFRNFGIGNPIKITGAPGTGKTFNLLAIGLMALLDEDTIKEDVKGVLLLSYNKVLVNHIENLYAGQMYSIIKNRLANIPVYHKLDSCTVISWYTNNLGINHLFKNVQKANFYQKSLEILRALTIGIENCGKPNCNQYFKNVNIKEIIINIQKSVSRYRLILIDEAQDLTKEEEEFIKILSRYIPIAICCSDSQKMRVHNQFPSNWNWIKSNTPLKKIIRSKGNISLFLKKFNAQKRLGENIDFDRDNLGEIYITEKNEPQKFKDGIKSVFSNAKKAIDEYNRNSPNKNLTYNDVLVLAPKGFKNLGNPVDMETHLADKSYYPEGVGGYIMFDDNKSEYPTNPNLFRIVNYKSSRGIEGWVVVLLCFDKYEEKLREQFKDKINSQTIINEHLFMALSRVCSSMHIHFYDSNNQLLENLHKILSSPEPDNALFEKP